MGLRGPKPRAARSKPLPEHPIGDPPQWLHEYAQAEWRRVKALNVHLGEVQAGLFAAYCQSFARWREAEEDVAKNGFACKGKTKNGWDYETPRPAVGIAARERTAMFRAARALELDAGEQAQALDPLAEHRKHAEGLRKPALSE